MSRFLYLGALLLVALIPTVSQSYFVTDTKQFSLDGKTGVFVIDYAFGHEKYDLSMPLRAVRGTTSPEINVLTYEVLNDAGQRGSGEAYAVILSKSPIYDHAYHATKGTRHVFRLLVLYKRTEDESGRLFTTQVTSLPFAFVGVRDLALNESELTKYRAGPLPFLGGFRVDVKSTINR